MGVILWELLTREKFFGEVTFNAELEDKLLRGERPPIPDDCIPSYADLIRYIHSSLLSLSLSLSLFLYWY